MGQILASYRLHDKETGLTKYAGNKDCLQLFLNIAGSCSYSQEHIQQSDEVLKKRVPIPATSKTAASGTKVQPGKTALATSPTKKPSSTPTKGTGSQEPKADKLATLKGIARVSIENLAKTVQNGNRQAQGAKQPAGNAAKQPSKAGKRAPDKLAAKANVKGAIRVQTPGVDQEVTREVTNDDFPVPVVETVKPADQVQLSAKELEEEQGRVLNAARPGPARVILRYNLEERAYKPEPQLEQVLVHYFSEGNLLHRDSEEGHNLAKAHAAEDERLAVAADQADSATDLNSSGKRLRNQFNFSERGIQTSFFPPRERGTSTEIPETVEASGACSQWEVFDAYVADQRQQRQQQEEANKQKGTSKVVLGDDAGPTEAQQSGDAADVLHSSELQRTLLMVSRMSAQNNLTDVILDFKYWEDKADAIKLGEGTLLPLWNFSSNLSSQKQVTAVDWSSSYSDLLVAAFGSFDFQRPSLGSIAGFSLKNTVHPEFQMQVRSGVMTLKLNPHNPNLLAIGCYDGSVAVFDVRHRRNSQPIYSSTPKSGSHARPVWAVEWLKDQTGAAHAFYSLSSDGRLLHWTLATAELVCQEILKLTQQPSPLMLPDKEPSQPVLAAACCMDFHPEQDFMVLVGTEEGAIYKCNTSHRTGHLLAYEGHAMSVYAVKWNKVHPTTFLSCSADWTVKLWHTNQQKAVMSFALGSPVGDVAWYPPSATIFAAVTEDGLTRVFDLHQNTAEPLCEQRVVAKVGLTRLMFNPRHPILLVGDDRGYLAALKLSPNLRRVAKIDSATARLEAEQERIDRVLEIARRRNQAIEKALASDLPT